jgi:hypothetical protein
MEQRRIASIIKPPDSGTRSRPLQITPCGTTRTPWIGPPPVAQLIGKSRGFTRSLCKVYRGTLERTQNWGMKFTFLMAQVPARIYNNRLFGSGRLAPRLV